jgi:diaminopropionate ammonia-lyase
MSNALAGLDCRVIRNCRRMDRCNAAETFLDRAELAAAACAVAGWSGYRPTPIVAFPGVARHLRLASFAIKLEEARFDVRSFKALGPPLALARALTRRLRQRGEAVDEQACRCVIFMAAHTGAEREQNILRLGAEVRRVPGTFDDALAAAVAASRDHGWCLIAELGDASDPQVPADTIRGYSVVGSEIAAQTADQPPTHLFLSAGSGAMAAGIGAAVVSQLGAAAPRIVTVEPDKADGLLRSARIGQRLPAEGDLRTVMDGLAVRWPSPHAWPVLRDLAFAFMAVPDDAALLALGMMAQGACGGEPLEIGETGIAAVAGALAAAASDDLRKQFDLTPSSRILSLACEGVTDRGEFDRLIEQARRRFPETCLSAVDIAGARPMVREP